MYDAVRSVRSAATKVAAVIGTTASERYELQKKVEEAAEQITSDIRIMCEARNKD